MCLTIPAKILEIDKEKAIIESVNERKKINISVVKDLKIGDWVLYIANFAVKKINKKDAKEIINLLQPYKEIDISKLDSKFKRILEQARIRNLTKDEIIFLLKIKDPIEKEVLFSEANIIRQTHLKDFICIHGIIEFSNFCENDCFYCGLQKKNQELKRYRMNIDEIVKVADKAVNEKGYKLLVLQSGEDYFYTDDMLSEIIKKIKKKCRTFLFMSIGERSHECYKRMKQAGCDGVLFRFETSNPKLFKKLHPKGKDFKKRFELLKFMRKLNYFIATGSIIGLPGQSIEDLADDILIMKKWANMISMGPFVSSDNTPLAKHSSGDPEMNLKMIAILRFLMPDTRIPVVTSLETLLGEGGRKKALQAGANSLMFNLTPPKYRSLYKIYPDKFFQKEEKWEKYGLFKYEESYKMLEERMRKELEKNHAKD